MSLSCNRSSVRVRQLSRDQCYATFKMSLFVMQTYSGQCHTRVQRSVSCNYVMQQSGGQYHETCQKSVSCSNPVVSCNNPETIVPCNSPDVGVTQRSFDQCHNRSKVSVMQLPRGQFYAKDQISVSCNRLEVSFMRQSIKLCHAAVHR